MSDTSTVQTIASGVAALGHEASQLLAAVDGVFLSWATEAQAQLMITSSLLPVDQLAELDYYRNFPHQAMVTAPLRLTGAKSDYQPERGQFSPDQLEPAELALPAAACYGVYLHLAGQELSGPTRFTVLGRCFRREENYEDLRRLLGFHMREVVALGTREFAEQHLAEFTARILEFAARLGLPLQRVPASDPFYDRGSSRALLTQLAPVKHEFVYGDLAIASVNTHRNFFGDRCDIRLAPSGETVVSSCVAFGLERWLSALTTHFGSWSAAISALSRALT